jgi:hypothetical protein
MKSDSILESKSYYMSTDLTLMSFPQIINTTQSLLNLAKAIPTSNLSNYEISTNEISVIETALLLFNNAKTYLLMRRLLIMLC